MRRPRKTTELEKRLGYTFKSRELFDRALTHASVRSHRGMRHDNERLEFMGDRVLGLAVAEVLHEAHPEANEGELARRYNRLVRGAACAAVARNLGLGPHLILSDSEAESGGREKETILADAMEALLGAIFVEAGFDVVREVVRLLWSAQFDELPHVVADPKSALQEWAQGQGLELPEYTEIARSGPDHAPRFVTEVRIAGRKPARGEGASKRQAEQAAASSLLAREGVRIDRGGEGGLKKSSHG
ncbi:MAG: ribonuclease III [Hyphomicrobiaceae bacterium]|nr:ribonuclease III [Hyphomicrobiaceae bacterium]